jgi:hypothetical protein
MIDTLEWAFANEPENVNLIMHGKTHYNIGQISDPDSLRAEFVRGWVDSTFAAIADTSALVDFAWPGGRVGGVARPIRSPKAMVELVTNGYRAGRSGGLPWNANEPGANTDTYLSWDNYVCKYLLWGLSGQNLFSDVPSAPTDSTTTAVVEDRLGDYIDSYYTDHDRAAIILYTHSYDFYSGHARLTPTNLQHLLDLASQWNSVEILPFDQILSMRLSGSPSVTPADVEAAALGQYSAMAAQQDSARTAGDGAELLQIWISPK